MNNHIKLLAEQAGLGQERWNTTEQFNSFLEKFSKLIILECVDCIKRVGILEDIEIEGDMISDAVKETFGVEE